MLTSAVKEVDVKTEEQHQLSNNGGGGQTNCVRQFFLAVQL